jgi:hypothetical protein
LPTRRNDFALSGEKRVDIAGPAMFALSVAAAAIRVFAEIFLKYSGAAENGALNR